MIQADITNGGTLTAKNGNLTVLSDTFTNTGLVRNNIGSNLFIDATTVNHTGNIEVNASGSVAFSPAITNGSGKTTDLKGGSLGTPTLTNASGGLVKGFGTITGDVINAGNVDLFGTSNLVGALTNQIGGHFLVRNDQVLITGHTNNQGTLETLNGKIIFEGGLTNSGALLFDPSTINVTTMTTEQTGYMAETGEPGDRFIISEDFVNKSNQNELWETSNTIFQFNGGSRTGANPQKLEVVGADLGAITAGWIDNFAFGSLEIGTSDTYVLLVDDFDNSAPCLTSYCEIFTQEAMYVFDLILSAGTVLDLAGYNLYVHNSYSNLGASVLNGSITVLNSAVPIPAPLLLFISGALALWRTARRRSATPMAVAA